MRQAVTAVSRIRGFYSFHFSFHFSFLVSPPSLLEVGNKCNGRRDLPRPGAGQDVSGPYWQGQVAALLLTSSGFLGTSTPTGALIKGSGRLRLQRTPLHSMPIRPAFCQVEVLRLAPSDRIDEANLGKPTEDQD